MPFSFSVRAAREGDSQRRIEATEDRLEELAAYINTTFSANIPAPAAQYQTLLANSALDGYDLGHVLRAANPANVTGTAAQYKMPIGTGANTAAWSTLVGASSELFACPDPQYNTSSAGQSYTDTAGDTYSELPSQTRLTMPAYASYVGIAGSWHVSAGTGTIQLFNFTDSSSKATATTTATTETALGDVSSVSGNDSDSMTIRVKNSSAGASVTLDLGGLVEGLTFWPANLSTSTYRQIVQFGGTAASFYPRTIKYIPLKYTSSTTFTGSILHRVTINTAQVTTVTLDSYTQADHGVIQTISLDKIYSAGGGGEATILSALSGTAGMIVTADLWGFNI